MSGLRGARVLVTRAAVDAGPLEELLLARGAAPVAFPCVELQAPTDPAPLQAALARLREGELPDLIVLASAHAAQRFFALAGAQCLRGVALAAAGDGTARALARLGRPDALVPERGVGAEALVELLAPRVAGKAVLMPRAEQGNPSLVRGLSAAGARVDPVALYRTAVPERADPAGLAELLAGRIDAVLFASGSAARGFAALAGAQAAGRAAVVCMGATSAAAARAAGLRVEAVASGGFAELCDAAAAALTR